MTRRFFFSPRVSGIGLICIVGMLCLSHWQWNRHLEKKAIIAELEARLEMPAVNIEGGASKLFSKPDSFIHRKALVKGVYDFKREIYIKNRRLEDTPGVIALTPIQIDGTDTRILVNRGFIPLKLAREKPPGTLALDAAVEFIGLIKESNPRKFLAPRDPETNRDTWHSSFLRIDIEHLAKQYPFPLAPFYVEKMSSLDTEEIKQAIVKTQSDKDEILMLPMRAINDANKSAIAAGKDFPVPFFSTVLPAGRHLGYVFEWAIMALMTAIICFILQLRPPRHLRKA